MEPGLTSVGLKLAVLLLVTLHLKTGESDFFISGLFSAADCPESREYMIANRTGVFSG